MLLSAGLPGGALARPARRVPGCLNELSLTLGLLPRFRRWTVVPRDEIATFVRHNKNRPPAQVRHLMLVETYGTTLFQLSPNQLNRFRRKGLRSKL